MIPVLTTERLILRPFTAGDEEDMFRIHQQEDIMHYFPNPKTPSREWITRFVDQILGHWETHGYGHWAVTVKGDDTCIGWAGLNYLPETDETEVAYLIDKAFWGRGFASECAIAAVHFAGELQLPMIMGVAHTGHKASHRVLEKAGLYYTGDAVYFGMPVCRFQIDL